MCYSPAVVLGKELLYQLCPSRELKHYWSILGSPAPSSLKPGSSAGLLFLLYRETIDQLALLSCRPIKVRAVYFSPNLVYSSRKDLISLRFIWSYYVHSNNFHRDYEKHCLENGITVVCDLWYICMIRYNTEFSSNEYEDYVATWKHAQYILLNGKIRMWNYMFIMITTIISYDYYRYYLWFFLCRNRDYNSSVRMRAMSYTIKKGIFYHVDYAK